MRKIISAAVLCFMAIGSVPTTFAQKIRQADGGKVTTRDVATSFSTAGAVSDGSGVFFKWQMEAEKDNFGFFIYRVGTSGPELVNTTKVVEGSAMRVGSQPMWGSEYSYFDSNSDQASAFYIESHLVNGKVITSPVFVPSYVESLEPHAGATSEELTARQAQAAGIREGSVLNLTRDLAKEVESYRLAADDNTHMSVISQPGVRIGVKGEGLFRVSRAELEDAGFDTSTDPAKWQLYVEGVEQAMMIGPNADHIEFYGKGANTLETNVRTYYLISGDGPGKRFGSRFIRPGTSTVVTKSYGHTYLNEENTLYIDSIVNGPADNYWGRAINATGTNKTFELTGIDFSSPNSRIVIRLQGFSSVTHNVNLTLNGNALNTASGFGQQPYGISMTIPTSYLVEGQNTLRLQAAASGDTSVFDYMTIEFARTFRADGDKLNFFTVNDRAVNLNGFSSSDVRLFDVTNSSEPAEVTNFQAVQTGSGFGGTIPAARGRVYYAVEGSQVKSADSVTPNDPTIWRESSYEADLVIIAYGSFMQSAETWANYRRGQGYAVQVVDVSEIYDEFNYGTLSASSIRSFLHYAYTNWAVPPSYVLLVGDASYDPLNHEGLGNFHLVPTMMVSTLFSETGSDDALVDFNNDGLSEMAIGRIPARVQSTIDVMYGKTVAWESTLSDPLARGALFAFDHPNGYDFEGMSNRLRSQLPQSTPTTMVYRGEPNANATLISELNTGKFLVNYSGHGTSGSWGGNPVFFNVNSVPQLTNAQQQSVFTMLTCLNGYFHGLHSKSFAEVLTEAPNGGAVAAWASTGLTTPDIQELMGGRFYNRVGTGSITRLGDLIRDAKAVIPGGTDVRLSWALIGDPMLRVTDENTQD